MKGFYISKAVAVAGIIIAVSAVATIIALSIVYSQEKAKNNAKPTEGWTTPPTATSTTPTPSNEPWDRYRLPDSLLPEHYIVTLWPRLHVDEHGMYIFTGNSTVVFRCVKETDLVLIHSNKLNFTQLDGHLAKLSTTDGSSPPAIKTTWLQVRTQYLVVQLNGNLVPGKSYQLFTEFRGELADDLGGFYRSEYYQGSQLKIVATTQMQPTDARKAFPCFDEPAMKAVFHMTLVHDRGTVALANGMEIETVNFTTNGVELSRTTFEPTEKMSTYLLAFVVSDFAHIRTPEGIRIWARRSAIAEGQGDYALNKTGPILEFFERYYNSTYPLSKSDQIALPDFSAGAMENWGLITYRETALLYDPHASSNGDKEWVATVISHELAHMWFGNLVTMKWWNDLWLNEGFATYVSYLGAHDAEPEWNVKDLIVLNAVHPVFAVDSLASSHPLSYSEEEINTPAQISELFDTITYSKGAAVLRMLSEFLSEPVFARGLSSYLKEYAYSNTVYGDLWQHLQKVKNTAGLELPDTVNEIMNRWILQMGFPVVTIDTQTGNISQKHFLLDPESVPARPSDYKYGFTSGLSPLNGQKMAFIRIKNTIILSSCSDHVFKYAELYYLNFTVVMRSCCTIRFQHIQHLSSSVAWYNKTSNSLMLNSLGNIVGIFMQIIPVINRAQIVDDTFNLARAKIVDTTLALRTTQYLSQEREYMPWQSAIRNLAYFFLMFERTEVYGPMQSYLKKQVQPLFEYFENITSNWEKIPTRHTDQYNQVNAISLACRTGVEGCAELTNGWYKQWMDNPENNTIHANLKSVVYCNAIAGGGEEEWDFGWRMFSNTTNAAEADKLMYALSCTKEPWLLNRYLEYSLDPNKIRKQDATFAIVYIARNVVGQPLAWDFIRAKWDYIFNEYGGGSISFSRLITGVTERFSTLFELQQVQQLQLICIRAVFIHAGFKLQFESAPQLQQFKEEHSQTGFGSAEIALEQAIEKTKANIRWVAENNDKVLKWFLSA
uniref:Aminopeptidase n=1 Tax=Denticeps clupeoides TaxID=299321 RepID=A0AAY4BEQ0_9TELE